jgi:hypothetical protein
MHWFREFGSQPSDCSRARPEGESGNVGSATVRADQGVSDRSVLDHGTALEVIPSTWVDVTMRN